MEDTIIAGYQTLKEIPVKVLVILFLTALSTHALAERIGLGAAIGNPTGLNGKYWLDDNKAFDGGLGFSLGRHTNFSLHSDYLLHSKNAFYFNDVNALDLYYGLGARMEFSNEIELGVRAPVGLAHQVENQNADVFGEVAPILNLVGGIGLEFHVLIGARYYF